MTKPTGNSSVFARTGACTSCFAEPGPGVYRLALIPSGVGGTQGTGAYVAPLEVTLPSSAVASTITPIDIP